MKLSFVVIIALLVIGSCSTTSKTLKLKGSNVIGFKATQIFPNINNNGMLNGYDTIPAFMYYFGKQIIYHLTSQTLTFDSVDRSLKPSGNSYYDFLFTQGNKNGLLLNRNSHKPEKVVPIDSMLKSEWVNHMNVYSILLDNEAHLISSKKITSSILEEVYSLKGIKDTSMNGKIILNFSTKRLAGNFSLSSELDSIKKMRLVKVRIINAPRYFKAAGINIDGAESGFDLEELKNIDESKLLPLFLKEKALNLN